MAVALLDCRMLNVRWIDNFVFSYGSRLTRVTIPDRVTRIGLGAFKYCKHLKGLYFQGNAPALSEDAFAGDTNLTIYYVEGTAGWTSRYGGRPTALWRQ